MFSKSHQKGPQMARTKPPRLQIGTDHADLVLVGDVCDELRQHLAIITGRREELAPGTFDEDLATAAAALGKVLIGAAAERRAQRRTAAREIASIPLETAIHYLMTLSMTLREDIARQLTGADDEEPLL